MAVTCFCGFKLDAEGHCEGCGELAYDCDCGETEDEEYGSGLEDDDFED